MVLWLRPLVEVKSDSIGAVQIPLAAIFLIHSDFSFRDFPPMSIINVISELLPNCSALSR